MSSEYSDFASPTYGLFDLLISRIFDMLGRGVTWPTVTASHSISLHCVSVNL
jgi:hypothetical protein